MQTFQSLLTKKLSEALARADLPEAGELTQATDPRFGDYQSNVALILGKQRGENPRALAETIVAQLDVSDVAERPAVAGAGFINFTLRPAAVEKQTLDVLRDECLGVAQTESPRRIVIDFGSPNVAKPMHVGHIRSTALGDTLARVAKFLGNEVIRDNHVGDWGTQFGMVIWGWKNLLDREALQRDPLDRRRGHEHLRPRAAAHGPVQAGVRLHHPDLPEPDRPHAARRPAAAHGRGARAARHHDRRGRPVRPDPLRGRAAAGGLRLRRQAHDLHVVVLEDDRARACESAG